MYLFILETIGTQELILIGIIALVVFGPRKLPEMARKLGSMMTEFRKVSGEFRSTWENAVNLEEFSDEPKKNINKTIPNNSFETENKIGVEPIEVKSENSNGENEKPEIKQLTGAEFKELVEQKEKVVKTVKSEKTDWL